MLKHGRHILKSLKSASPVSMAVALGAAYFLVQLLFIHSYGVTWDEPLHRSWGQLFAEYVRTGDRGVLGRMEFYGLYYSPLYFFAEYLTSKWVFMTGLFSFAASNHLLNLLTASVGVGTLFVFAGLVGGRSLGFLSVFFLLLFPPFIAHSHYNPKDIPLMTALLLTATVFLSGLTKKRRRQVVLSGVMLGACIALKVSAALMIPVFLTAYVVSLFDGSHKPVPLASLLKKEMPTALLLVAAVPVGLVLAWPSAWTDLAVIPDAFHFFFRSNFWNGSILYFGKMYKAVDLPFYYSFFEFFLSTPAVTILCAGIGSWIGLRFLRSRHHRPVFILLFLWILIPLLASCKPGLPRYDGMRQFFFCLPPIAVLAALGCREACVVLSHHFASKQRVASLLLLLITVSLFREIALIHPYEGAYRNETARWLIPKDMDRVLEVEYWGAVYNDGVKWLNRHAELNAQICVPVADFLIEWYPLRSDLQIECSPQSTYVMYFTRYAALKGAQKALASLDAPVYTVHRYQAAFLKIFKLR